MTAARAARVSVGFCSGSLRRSASRRCCAVGSAELLVVHRIATRDEVALGREVTVTTAHQVVEPAVTDAIVASEPDDRRRFDVLMRTSFLKGRVVPMKAQMRSLITDIHLPEGQSHWLRVSLVELLAAVEARAADLPPCLMTGRHGLRLLGELAREAGGSLAVTARTGGGNRFVFMPPKR